MIKFKALLLFLALSATITGAQTEQNREFEQWQTVTLSAEKIGHRHITRTIVADTINTREELVIVTRQPGEKPRKTRSVVDYFEGLNGKPLEILKTVTTKNSSHQMTARVEKKRLLVVPDNKLTSEPVSYKIPQPFYLREGARLALLKKHGNERKLEYFTWSFTKFRFEKIRLTAIKVSPNAPNAPSWQIKRERLGYADGKTNRFNRVAKGKVTTLFANDALFIVEEHSLSGGEPFVLQTCDKDCALQSFKPLIHVYRQLIKSPYRITDSALNGKVRYTLSGEFHIEPPQTGEQTVTPLEGGYKIEVCHDDCGNESPPTAEMLTAATQANYWLASDAEEFKSAIAQVIPKDGWNNAQKMSRLSSFVHNHMQVEVNFSGYATAYEAFKSRSGDCTENALLLAALGRAAGIPTRVVVGLAYNNDQFFGRRYVFVPHAWVQAWTGQRWQSFDAGLEGFTSGYIALALSNGEQAEFYRVAEQLHLLDIDSAVQVKKKR
ncbi:transglutaminase superfamily protein [Alteromonadaceae bacterium 2753L.S.0a.02]|nr:transglutaminase superfamily protein [Alteromonadaceae bacterium 2753L.S.0a.02]